MWFEKCDQSHKCDCHQVKIPVFLAKKDQKDLSHGSTNVTVHKKVTMVMTVRKPEFCPYLDFTLFSMLSTTSILAETPTTSIGADRDCARSNRL